MDACDVSPGGQPEGGQDQSHREHLLQRHNDALVALARCERLYEGRFEDLTETAARTLCVRRASVWLYDDDRSKIHCVDLYELSEGRHSSGAELGARSFPSYFDALRTERTIAAHDAHTDARTREFADSYLTPLGITSMLDAPIRIGGHMIGVICHEHVGPPRRWAPEEQSFAGSMADFCAVAMEARERQRVEAALRDSETRYRTLFESANDGLFLLEGDRFVECNPTTLAIFGCTREQILGKTPFDFSPEKQPDGRLSTESGMEKIEAALAGRSVRFEWRHVRPDGSAFDTEVGLGCLDLPGKRYLLAMVRDITDRKRAQQELAEYRSHLEDLVKERTAALKAAQQELVYQERLAAVGQVTASVSHEIRNPLQSIRGSFYLVGQALEGKGLGLDAVLDRIERNIIRCDRVVEDLADFTRAHLLEPELTRIDGWLGQLLDQQVFPEEMDVSRDLSCGVEVAVDRERLGRCVTNVITNACQAFSEGDTALQSAADLWRQPRLVVETRVAGGCVEIRISDNGCGIPPDRLETVFEPFYSTKGFGVGLGLPIVRQLMELHKGGVEIDSLPKRGTTVVLWLPLPAGSTGSTPASQPPT